MHSILPLKSLLCTGEEGLVTLGNKGAPFSSSLGFWECDRRGNSFSPVFTSSSLPLVQEVGS